MQIDITFNQKTVIHSKDGNSMEIEDGETVFFTSFRESNDGTGRGYIDDECWPEIPLEGNKKSIVSFDDEPEEDED